MEYQVTFRNKDGKIGRIDVQIEDETSEPHQEAILQVKEELVRNGEGYSGAVLALIPSVQLDQPLAA